MFILDDIRLHDIDFKAFVQLNFVINTSVNQSSFTDLAVVKRRFFINCTCLPD